MFVDNVVAIEMVHYKMHTKCSITLKQVDANDIVGHWIFVSFILVNWYNVCRQPAAVIWKCMKEEAMCENYFKNYLFTSNTGAI